LSKRLTLFRAPEKQHLYTSPQDMSTTFREKTTKKRYCCDQKTLHYFVQAFLVVFKTVFRELEENNIRISCRTFVRLQGVMAGA